MSRPWSRAITEERDPVVDLLEGATDLRLVRLRLFLALLTMFAIPLAIAVPVVYGTAIEQHERVLIPTAAIAVLAMVLGVLTVWLAKRVLEPAQRLDEARARYAHAYASARELALRDALTGLGNHRAFQEELLRQSEITRRHGAPFALVIIDLDGFKTINDLGGHAAGDALLQQFAATIKPALRRTDIAYRVGGDEFAIILPHCDADGAAIFVRRLLASSLDPGDRLAWSPRGAVAEGISFSAGISATSPADVDPDSLFRKADAALYWGKRHGRTCVTVFDPAKHDGSEAGHSLPERSAAVARVATMGAIRAVFQPIFDLRSGVPRGYEGLVRPLPGTGFADPGTMFRAAEATGRTVELDLACLDAVLARSAQLALPGSLTLNLSPRTLESDDFSVTTLIRMLARYGVAPERTVVELTERQAIEEPERLSGAVQALRAAGLRLAADDVGAGNAGLRLLAQLRFDIVKIDLSLVQGGAVRATSQEVVRTLTDLADRWGALVIAEGVETPEQLAFVRSLGIRAGQGYLLGRPAEDPERDPIDLDRLQQSPFEREAVAAGSQFGRGLRGAAPSRAPITAAAEPTAFERAIAERHSASA